MEKITSFTVNHLTLLPGVHISRIDTQDGFTFTTYDLRVTRPNFEPVMNTTELHSIEHLGATFFRNTLKETLYFGPYGLPHRILFDCSRQAEQNRHYSAHKRVLSLYH